MTLGQRRGASSGCSNYDTRDPYPEGRLYGAHLRRGSRMLDRSGRHLMRRHRSLVLRLSASLIFPGTLLGTLLASGSVHATDYYVATTGSDSNAAAALANTVSPSARPFSIGISRA